MASSSYDSIPVTGGRESRMSSNGGTYMTYNSLNNQQEYPPQQQQRRPSFSASSSGGASGGGGGGGGARSAYQIPSYSVPVNNNNSMIGIGNGPRMMMDAPPQQPQQPMVMQAQAHPPPPPPPRMVYEGYAPPPTPSRPFSQHNVRYQQPAHRSLSRDLFPFKRLPVVSPGHPGISFHAGYERVQERSVEDENDGDHHPDPCGGHSIFPVVPGVPARSHVEKDKGLVLESFSLSRPSPRRRPWPWK